MPTIILTKEQFEEKRKELEIPEGVIAIIERRKGEQENTVYGETMICQRCKINEVWIAHNNLRAKYCLECKVAISKTGIKDKVIPTKLLDKKKRVY